MKLLQTIKNIWKIEELRTRILLTLGIFGVPPPPTPFSSNVDVSSEFTPVEVSQIFNMENAGGGGVMGHKNSANQLLNKGCIDCAMYSIGFLEWVRI